MPGQNLGLRSALRALAENVAILPATGGAAEKLPPPDAAGVVDADVVAQDGDLDAVGETAATAGPLAPVSNLPGNRSRPLVSCPLTRYS